MNIENDDGESLRFKIVGADEIYERKDYISINSPMARALLKKQVGDEALVKTPERTNAWYITAIEYDVEKVGS